MTRTEHTTSISIEPGSLRPELLVRELWRRRKGHYVRRHPRALTSHCKRLRVQNRPMLSNTSCSALLAPGACAAASSPFPP